MSKISIVIPVYNVEKYIDCCVKSVINQTMKDIEIILVDDGSKDESSVICDKYSVIDNRIKVIHKENEGLGYARNSGIDVATGEFITFLDSDDFIDLNTYERLCNIMSEHSLDVLFYRYERFNDESKVMPAMTKGNLHIYSDEEIKDFMADIIASKPSSLKDHEVECSSCSAVYRLNVINSNHIRFKSERELISEDLIFNLDFLCCAQKIAIDDTSHYHYRYNESSLTKTIRPDRINKNIILYNYINSNNERWGLLKSVINERNNRLFIGNSRSAIVQYVNSKLTYAEKVLWLRDVLSNPIWQKIYNSYNWQPLPLFHRLFLQFCYLNMPLIIIILCKLRKFIAILKI